MLDMVGLVQLLQFWVLSSYGYLVNKKSYGEASKIKYDKIGGNSLIGGEGCKKIGTIVPVHWC